jgi:hypothetical protein
MKLEQQVCTHNTEQLELQLRLQQFHQKERGQCRCLAQWHGYACLSLKLQNTTASEHRQQHQQQELDWELVHCTLNNLVCSKIS